MKKLTANFYPANEPTHCANGADYLGKADITIANAVRLNGISVFRDKGGEIDIQFPGFGDGGSYVVPHSKEAYAAMRDVVAMAIDDNAHHFGYNKGDYGVHLEVSGKAVQEPYADARFSVSVADVCTLHGITTRPVEYAKDGKDKSFVAVDLPTIGSYEKDGETQYQTAFEGRISAWEKDGEQHSRNYGQLMQGLVLGERKSIFQERKPSLNDQLKDASARQAAQPEKNHTAPERERG